MDSPMGVVGGTGDKRKKTSPNTTPKKTKRARFVRPENSSKGENATTDTGTGQNEATAQTSPSKSKVKSGAFIDSSESDATLAHNTSTTQSTTDTVRAPVIAGLASRSILKSTEKAETGKSNKPPLPDVWFDRTNPPDRASASGSQRGASRSFCESSSTDHSTDSEVTTQLSVDERRGSTRTYWAPTQASGGVAVHQALAATVAPLTRSELFYHLAESTLIYQHNRAIFDTSTGPSPAKVQQVRNSIIDSIIHYLGPNGGITQENLARKLARAQAMRVDPRNLPAINQMMAQLTGLPFGPIQDDNLRMAAALATLELTSPRTSESRYNAAADPRRMDSEHGRRWMKGAELQYGLRNNLRPEHIQEGDSFRILVDKKIISLTKNPIQELNEDDIRAADLDELQLSRFRANLKLVSEDAKKAEFWRREAGNDEEYRKGRNGIFDKLYHKVAPPLTERVEWIKKNMANAPPPFPNDDDDDEMLILSTVSASSRCHSKKSKMASVYVMIQDEIAASAFTQSRTIPQFDGSNDGQMDLLEQELDQEMADLMLQPPLVPINYCAKTPLNEIPAKRLNQFVPFGQTTHIKSDEYTHPDDEMLQRIKAAYPPGNWRELSRIDAYGVIKDELDLADAMSISDTGADGGIDDENEDASMKDDGDKSMAHASPFINQEDYNPEQAQADHDNQIELQIELLVKEYGVQEDPLPLMTPLPADPKKMEKTVERQETTLRAIQGRRDKVITGLPHVMRSKWTEHERLRDLHMNVSQGFPPSAKAPKEKVAYDRCGSKSHLTKNCKERLPRKGWEPVKGNKPFAMGNTDANEGTQGQCGPSKIGKRSRAGYLQALIDSEPNNRFDTRVGARAPLGGFDGSVDAPPHIPAHLPKLGLDEFEVAEAKQQHHGYSSSMSLKGGDLPPVRPSRVLSKPDDLPMSKQDARKANRLQEMNNARAYLGGFDGADDGSSKEQFDAPANIAPAPSQNPGPSSARRVRMLSKSDDLPPSRRPSVDSPSLRGGDLSASIKEGVTKEQDNMPTFKDDDVEMHDVMEMPFPSLLDGRTSAEREESVGLDDFMDEVNAQLISEAMNIEGRGEVEQDQAAVNQEVQIAVARQALRVALGRHVAQQLLVQSSIEVSSQAPSPTGDMSMPLPSSQASQTRKMPATPNPFRALSDTPDPIEAAGREPFPLRDTPIASTPATNAAQNPFRRSRSSSVPATPVYVMDDEEDGEQIMFTPLDAKTQTGKAAGLTRPAEINADGRDEDHNIAERTEGPEDDDSQPGIGIAIATPKKKKARKSLTARAISNVEEIQPKSDVKPKRKTSKSLKTAQTEVPETSDIEAAEDNTKVTTSEKKKSARRKAGNTLVVDPVVENENLHSSKPRRRATRQSIDAAEKVPETPQTAKCGNMKRQAVGAKSEKKNAPKKRRTAEAEEAEAFEVEVQESSQPTRRSNRTQSIASGGDAVIESVETPARKVNGKQTEKRATRSRTATPRAKSATAELQSNGSNTTLYYDTHEWMLPVEIGDRVVRKLSKEDRRLYSKVDEYDEFTGPWIVLDLKIRKRDKERIAQVLDNNLSEEARSIAWNETLTALVKISIPEEAQTKDKVSPWVELRTLLPVLDVDGVHGGKLGPAHPLLEDFDSYKALKKKLATSKWKDGSMNVIRRKEARTGDQDAESSLGLVNLRKNVFVAVLDVDPNWRENDEYEVEKIRKKKLKLVPRSRATDDELDHEDTDKWQEILKHKTGGLDDYVIIVNWWVQWAGWPLESCTWEPRSSFGSNTRVMDYYNSNLDVFLDTPIEGVRYPLQLLFDYEDRYIEECRRMVAKSRRVAKKAKPKRVRQKEVASEHEEEKRARERRERELAAALFADDDAPKQKTLQKRRPQMDDEAFQKDGPPSDWDEELFGPWAPDSPEKSQPAPVPPTAIMMQPRGTASPSKVPTPKTEMAAAPFHHKAARRLQEEIVGSASIRLQRSAAIAKMPATSTCCSTSGRESEGKVTYSCEGSNICVWATVKQTSQDLELAERQ